MLLIIEVKVLIYLSKRLNVVGVFWARKERFYEGRDMFVVYVRLYLLQELRLSFLVRFFC